MGDQTVEDAEVSLSEPAAEWLRGRAAELGLPEDDLLEQLVAVFRQFEDEDAAEPPAFASADEVEELRERVEALDADFEADLTDVRERVVQVKRETDQKAPADHDHPTIERNVDAALQAAHAAQADVGDLEEHVEAGFSNYEDVLEYLTDDTTELHEKVGALARVTIDLRDAVEHLAAREAHRSATERLAKRANELGVRRASCEECGESLDVALLTDPSCPECDSTFTDVEPKQGFLGSPTLVVGDRPALESPAVEELDSDALADLADGETERPQMDEYGLLGSNPGTDSNATTDDGTAEDESPSTDAPAAPAGGDGDGDDGEHSPESGDHSAADGAEGREGGDSQVDDAEETPEADDRQVDDAEESPNAEDRQAAGQRGKPDGGRAKTDEAVADAAAAIERERATTSEDRDTERGASK